VEAAKSFGDQRWVAPYFQVAVRDPFFAPPSRVPRPAECREEGLSKFERAGQSTLRLGMAC
jgi:hypothetical protein